MYTSAPPITSVCISSVFLNVKKARFPQTSHREVNLVTESARGIISSTQPKLLLQTVFEILVKHKRGAIFSQQLGTESCYITTLNSPHLVQQLLLFCHHDQQLHSRNHKDLQRIGLHQYQLHLAVTTYWL